MTWSPSSFVELEDQAGLAHAGLAHDVNHLGLFLLDPGEGGGKGFHFGTPAHQFGQPPHQAGLQTGVHTSSFGRKTVDPLGLLFPLQGKFPYGFFVEVIPDDSMGLFTHPHLACLAFCWMRAARLVVSPMAV